MKVKRRKKIIAWSNTQQLKEAKFVNCVDRKIRAKLLKMLSWNIVIFLFSRNSRLFIERVLSEFNTAMMQFEKQTMNVYLQKDEIQL